MAERNLVVRVIGDESSYLRSLNRSTAATKQFDNTVTRSASRVDAAFTKINKVRTGAFLGGAAAAAGIAAIKRTTDAASDLNEQISKSRQVFGQSSQAIEAWSKTTARSIGVSQTAALEATGTFGNLFDAIGVGGPQAADTSKRLVQLAADLASFNNADPSEVLNAIRSGLVGEAEPLRRYGVLLSEARVQQVALAQTGKTNVKSLTDQEKALARVSIIFKDTSNAQGDFERTSESLANQQRILAANVADLEANLGKLLLPAVTKITGALSEATDAALTLTTALSKLGDVKIPPIEIPFISVKLPGSGTTIGDAVANVIEDALNPKKIAARVNPVGNIALTLDKLGLLDGLFDKDKIKGEVDRAAQDAIGTALSGFKLPELPKPKLRPPGDFGKQKGVDFGFAESITGAIDSLISGGKKALADATGKVRQGLNTERLKEELDKKRDAFATVFEKLSLGVDRASLTRNLNDDLAALQTLKAGLDKQVRSGVEAADAQSRLVGVVAQIADTRRQIAEQAAKITQVRQFRALGLTGTGDEIIPGVENLRKQLDSLSKSVIGQDVPTKLINRLAGVRKLLSGQFGKLTDETRAKIKELFDTIRGEFDKGNEISGKAFRVWDISNMPIGGAASFGHVLRPINAGGGAPIVIESHVHLDGKEIAVSTTRQQQKKRLRNATQTTGRFGGI